MLISLVIGAIIGNGLDLDKKLAHLVEYLQNKVPASSGSSMRGAIALIMLQNIGSLAILAPLNLGLSGSADIMQFKIILDVITTFLFSATYGFAVALSGVVGLVMNTVGNIFSGQVVGETAKTLSERFGKVLQKRQSISINRQDVSTSINTQMDALIPPSKISGLTQGMFVGSVSDNFNERIEQKIFHCEIVVDAEKVKREEKAYKKIPVITDFTDEDGNDHMKETVQANYRRIKEEVKQIVQEELERIANDDNLKHLLQQK